MNGHTSVRLRVDFHCSMRTHVKFTCVNTIEAMYGRPRGNVKVELPSIFTLTRGLSYIQGHPTAIFGKISVRKTI